MYANHFRNEKKKMKRIPPITKQGNKIECLTHSIWDDCFLPVAMGLNFISLEKSAAMFHMLFKEILWKYGERRMLSPYCIKNVIISPFISCSGHGLLHDSSPIRFKSHLIPLKKEIFCMQLRNTRTYNVTLIPLNLEHFCSVFFLLRKTSLLYLKHTRTYDGV